MFRIRDFFQEEECQKTDARTINAKLELKLDPLNKTGFILENPWGDTGLDIKKLIKAGETVTHLELAPAISPSVLRYEREDGKVDCITGDEFSHIISMRLLKDVDQETKLAQGDVYIYGADEKFHPFQLGAVLKEYRQTIERHNATVLRLDGEIAELRAEVEKLKELLKKPDNTPDNAKLAWGNINVYGDISNTGLKTSGIYTHDVNSNITNDMSFS